MYRQPAFAMDDAERLTAFVRAHPFAVVAINGEDGPLTAHLPIVPVADGEGRLVELVAHAARAGAFWRAAHGANAVAVFSGPNAYVSPSLYPSKAEHGRVAPTWNYQRAEVRGVLSVVDGDAAALRPFLDAITGQQEQGRDHPWAVGDAPEDYVAKLSGAIVGLRLAVSSATGVFKLSQNQKAQDRNGVLAAFCASDHPDERAVALAMAENP